MSLSEENRNDIINLYLEKTERTLNEADLAIKGLAWGMAANRLYYSLFHAVSAMMIKDSVPISSHRGLKAKFGEYYVLTGKFSMDHAKVLAQLETLRDRADYNVMFVASEKDVLPHVNKIKEFIVEIKNYIMNNQS